MKRLSLIWLLLPAIALLAAFIVMPTFDLIRASIFDPEFTLEHFQRLVERGVYVDVMWRTVRVSLIVAVICTIVGYPVAMFINLQPKKRQVALLFLILIPMWMSVLIRTFAWIVVLGREGLINDLMIGLGLTGAPVQMLYTSGTVITAMVQIMLPIQIITCYSAMTEIDLDLMRGTAGRTSGHDDRQPDRIPGSTPELELCRRHRDCPAGADRGDDFAVALDRTVRVPASAERGEISRCV